MTQLLILALAVSGTGLAFGIILAIAAKIFAVEQDERIDQVIEALPGANCGGCGYSGCAALAEAIVKGEASVNSCPVGGVEVANKIAQIMGVKSEDVIRKRSICRCAGVKDAAFDKYEYTGLQDCVAASRLSGGQKVCQWGCLGLGTCVRACMFGAIQIVDGVAVVDKDKCTACGLCVKACPKSLFALIPYDAEECVLCKNQNKGVEMRNICTAGCIACKICEKACDYDAIHVVDNIAKIDYSKCVKCGECVKKCPKKIIRLI